MRCGVPDKWLDTHCFYFYPAQRVASQRLLDGVVFLNRYWYRKSEDALPITTPRSDETSRDCEKCGL